MWNCAKSSVVFVVFLFLGCVGSLFAANLASPMDGMGTGRGEAIKAADVQMTTTDPDQVIRDCFGENAVFDSDTAGPMLKRRFGSMVDEPGVFPKEIDGKSMAETILKLQYLEKVNGRSGSLYPKSLSSNPTSLIVVFKDDAMTSSKKGARSPNSAVSGLAKSMKPLLKKELGSLTKKKARLKKGQSLTKTRAERNLSNMYIVEAQAGETLGELSEKFSASPLVEYVHYDTTYSMCSLPPNDPYFEDEQWSLDNTGQAYHDSYHQPKTGTPGADIGWLTAYTNDATFPTNAVLVAVIDTGVDYEHQELSNQMWINPGETGLDTNGFDKATNGKDDDANGYVDDVHGINAILGTGDPMDDHGHGTHCSATIAAETDNDWGMAGIAPNAIIMGCKFISPKNGGKSADALLCIQYAVDMGAKVLNNSWGGGGYSQALQDMITYATEQGAIFIAAAGNSNTELISYPGGMKDVFAVCALDGKDARAGFSNYGAWCDISAPGQDIFSARASQAPRAGFDDFTVMSGTSMACPTIVGSMALLVAKRPGHLPWIYEQVMETTCDAGIYDVTEQYGNAGYEGKLGAGRVYIPDMLAYMETNAWVRGRIHLGGEYGSAFADPNSSIPMTLSIGTWEFDVTNLSVRVTSLSDNVSMNTTEYNMGTVAARSEVAVPEDTFIINVNKSAYWGSVHYVQVEVMQGDRVLDTGTVGFQIFPAKVANSMVYDLDGDGMMEIIGTFGDSLTALNSDGTVKWYTTVPLGTGKSLSEVSVGDVDGDGKGEIFTTAWGVGMTSDIDLYRFEFDGTLATNDYWPQNYGNKMSASPPILADVDGDSNLEVLLPVAGTQSSVSVLDGVTGQQIRSYSAGLDGQSAAVGDVDGDGTNEVVVIWSDLYDSRLRVYRHGESNPYINFSIRGHIPRGWINGEERGDWFGIGNAYPALGDVDGDGFAEIFMMGISGYCSASPFEGISLVGYRLDGTQLGGFPIDMGPISGEYEQPSLADMDDDGDLEIVVGQIWSSTYRVFHHDGSEMPGLSSLYISDYEKGIIPILQDLNSDGKKELIVLDKHRFDSSKDNPRGTYRVSAYDNDGLMIPGFPYEKAHDQSLKFFLELQTIPLYSDIMQTNFVIMSSAGDGVDIKETGQRWDPDALHWPMPQYNAQRTGFLPRKPGRLIGNMICTNRSGFGPVNAVFSSHVSGTNTTGLYYKWDFDNDGTWDYEGYGCDTATNLYSNDGFTSVGFSVSNSAGEVYTTYQKDFIERLVPISADFTANVTSGSSPMGITFLEASTGPVKTWEWDFGDGNSIKAQHPIHVYTNEGTFSVSLTVKDFHGSEDTKTLNNYITISGVSDVQTNFYAALDGSSIYPYATWETAATNPADAAAACMVSILAMDEEDRLPSTIWVNNGLYKMGGRTLGLGDFYASWSNAPVEVSIRSVNGPLVTIFDYEGQSGGIRMQGTTNALVEGFTVRGVRKKTLQGGAISAFAWSGGGENPGLVIKDCIIVDNAAMFGQSASAGGVTVGPEAEAMINTVVASNNARTWAGGIFRFSTMSNCVIRDNGEGSASGAQIGKGGGGEYSTIHNCLFTGNSGEDYAIHLLGGEMFNCTVADNKSTLGAFRVTGSGTLITVGEVVNSIFDNPIGGDIFLGVGDGTDASTVRFKNCISQNENLNNQLNSDGNLQGDPGFVDAAGGNYRLAPTSDCIDAGTNYLTVVGYNDPTTIYFDFAPSNTTSGTGWNNITDGSAGVKISNAQNTDGDTTTIDLAFLDDMAGSFGGGDVFSNWPSSTTDGFYTDNLDTDVRDWVEISGLDPNSFYDLWLVLDGEEYVRMWAIDKINDHQDVGNQNWGDWYNLEPTADGKIILRWNGSTYVGKEPWAPVCGIELREKAPITVVSVTNQVDLDGMPRVHGSSVDIGCFENNGNYPPVAKLTATPPSGPSPLNVSLFADTSFDTDGTITNYVWEFGDGSSSIQGASLSTMTHTYSNEGLSPIYSNDYSYVAKVTVFDDDGRSDYKEIVINVLNAVPPTPTGFVGSLTNSSADVHLSWSDGSFETGYEIARGAYGGFEEDLIIDQDDFNRGSHTGYSTKNGRCELAFDTYGFDSWSSWLVGTNNLHTSYGPTYPITLESDEDTWDVTMGYRHNYGRQDGYDMLTAAFFPNFRSRGRYEVYVWYPEHEFNGPYDGYGVGGTYSNCLVTTAAGYDIKHADGTDTVYVNQRENQGQWVSLGQYNFAPGHFVRLFCYANINQVTLVDAMRFRRIVDYEPVAQIAAGETEWTDSNVVDHTTYNYYIRATNEWGASEWTEAYVHVPTTNALPNVTLSSAGSPPQTPSLNIEATGIASSPEGTIVNYEWNFGDGFAGSIQRGASLTNTSYTYLNPGDYEISLTAYDALGFSSTVSTSITVQGDAPLPPSDLQTVATGEDTITLSWTDGSYNEDGFEIERKGTGAFATLGSTGVSVDEYSDTTVLPGSTHTYRVRATNEYGVSEWSNESTTNTVDLTPATLLSAEVVTNTTIVLTFNEDVEETSAENAANYTLTAGGSVIAAERSTTNNAEVTLTVSPLTQNVEYTLTVNDVDDLFANSIVNEQAQVMWQIFDVIYFDFGKKELTTGNWNNVIARTNGTVVANAVLANGSTSTVSLCLTSGFSGAGQNGMNVAGAYPSSAQRDEINTTGSDTFELSGLNLDTDYTLIFFGSRTEPDELTSYSVGTNTVTLDCTSNTTETVQMVVAPNSNGVIEVTVDNALGDRGVINVLELKCAQPSASADLELATTSVDVPEGSTSSFGVHLTAQPETSVNVTVAHVSGDADITVQAGSETLTFTTNNWGTYQYPVLVAAQDPDFADGVAIIRCSATGMTDQDVTATESDDETNPAFTIPWEETFEARTNGAIAGQNGWTGTGTVQTATFQSGTKALSLSESSVAHSFDGNPSNVWITLWAQPVPGIEPETIASGASAVFYVSTNDLLVAYSNETPIEIVGATVSNGWNKFALSCDYASKVWNLELNETLVVSNYAFHGAPTSFQSLEIVEASTNALFVDSISLTDQQADPDDQDGDGIPNGWEQKHYGGTTNAIATNFCANGVNTVREAYIAGLNPTNSASRFKVSNLSAKATGSILSWDATNGRVYSVYWSSNLLSPFVLLTNELSWESNVFTDETHNAESKGFYKIEVELE